VFKELNRNVWFECLFLAAISLVLYLGVFTVFLFLIPLELIYLRHGREKGLILSLTVFIAIIGILTFTSQKELSQASIFTLNIGTVAVFISLLWILNINLQNSFVERILLVSISAFFFVILLLLYIHNTSSIYTQISQSLRHVLQTSGLFSEQDVNTIIQMIYRVFLSSLSLMFVSAITLTFFLSRWIQALLNKTRVSFSTIIQTYKLPHPLVWLFLVSWIIILSQSYTMFLSQYFISIFWNLALVVSFLYLLQGFSVLERILRSYGLKQHTVSRILMVILLLSILPQVGFILGLLLTLLGVGDLWIVYPKKVE